MTLYERIILLLTLDENNMLFGSLLTISLLEYRRRFLKTVYGSVDLPRNTQICPLPRKNRTL